jgi:hypothetical protein
MGGAHCRDLFLPSFFGTTTRKNEERFLGAAEPAAANDA